MAALAADSQSILPDLVPDANAVDDEDDLEDDDDDPRDRRKSGRGERTPVRAHRSSRRAQEQDRYGRVDGSHEPAEDDYDEERPKSKRGKGRRGRGEDLSKYDSKPAATDPGRRLEELARQVNGGTKAQWEQRGPALESGQIVD